MTTSRLNLISIFLSLVIIVIAFLFRLETIISALFAVLLFWILFGIGKKLVKDKSFKHTKFLPLISLISVFSVGVVLDSIFGISILLPKEIINITKIISLGRVEQLATTCQIKGYSQSHSNSYTIILKDNSTIYLPRLLETKDRNLAGYVKSNRDKCGEIYWGIE